MTGADAAVTVTIRSGPLVGLGTNETVRTDGFLGAVGGSVSSSGVLTVVGVARVCCEVVLWTEEEW